MILTNWKLFLDKLLEAKTAQKNQYTQSKWKANHSQNNNFNPKFKLSTVPVIWIWATRTEISNSIGTTHTNIVLDEFWTANSSLFCTPWWATALVAIWQSTAFFALTVKAGKTAYEGADNCSEQENVTTKHHYTDCNDDVGDTQGIFITVTTCLSSD